MIYRIYQPQPQLAAIIEHYWYSKIDLTQSLLQVYPTPILQGMTFNFRKLKEKHSLGNRDLVLDKQVYLFGQPTGYRNVETSDEGIEIIGVKFQPLGIARITGINMREMADNIFPAEDIWGREIELLCDQMQSLADVEQSISVLENFLLKKYHQINLHYRSQQVEQVLELLSTSRGATRMTELQRTTNITRKTLERSFYNYLGVSPKRYAQIVRFNAAKSLIELNPKIQYAEIAYQLGYFDHSHFISEFKRFAGVTPGVMR
jgi:AraC-like DNA-binding protein